VLQEANDDTDQRSSDQREFFRSPFPSLPLLNRPRLGKRDKHIQTIYCERGTTENEESRLQSQIALDFPLGSPGNQKRAFVFSLQIRLRSLSSCPVGFSMQVPVTS
jgi:hypothetical protein